MFIPLAEAVERVTPLIEGGLFERLAKNSLLKERLVKPVNRWYLQKPRNFLVWLMHNHVLTVLSGEGDEISLVVDNTDYKTYFRLHDKKTEHYVDEDCCHDEVRDNAVYFDAEDFNALEGFLSTPQTYFLDWQLAYMGAGKVPPLAYEALLLQRKEPDSLPEKVKERLAYLRQSPAPLFSDGEAGELKLYAWDTFRAFAGRQGWHLPDLGAKCNVNRIFAKSSPPAPKLRLSEFIEVLEQARNKTFSKPYYRLPAREAVYLMLTGKGDEKSTKNLQNSFYPLKLFDDFEKEYPMDRELPQLNNTLLTGLWVKLEEIVLVYEGHKCGCFPWLDTDGQFDLYPAGEYADQYKKPVHIACEEAINILWNKFPGVTNLEISLWLSFEKTLTVKDSPYANAKDINYQNELTEYAQKQIEHDLDDFLYRWYFSKTEVEAFRPSLRWHEYSVLIGFAPRHYLPSEAALRRVIRREIDLKYIKDWNPTPWTDDGKVDTIIKAAMYSDDVFPLIFKGWSEGEESTQASESEEINFSCGDITAFAGFDAKQEQKAIEQTDPRARGVLGAEESAGGGATGAGGSLGVDGEPAGKAIQAREEPFADGSKPDKAQTGTILRAKAKKELLLKEAWRKIHDTSRNLGEPIEIYDIPGTREEFYALVKWLQPKLEKIKTYATFRDEYLTPGEYAFPGKMKSGEHSWKEIFPEFPE